MLVVRATVQVLRGWSSPPIVHQHMSSVGQACMQQNLCSPAGCHHGFSLPSAPSCGYAAPVAAPSIMQSGFAPSMMLQPASGLMASPPTSPGAAYGHSSGGGMQHYSAPQALNPGQYAPPAHIPVLVASASPVHQHMPAYGNVPGPVAHYPSRW